MRVNTLSSDVATAGLGGAQSFRMKPTGTAFDALIASLYSDKAGSITREIYSNAVDSHYASRRLDLAPVVKVPNNLDLRFAVRDFGHSLAHDEVMELYTTVFDSTKQNDDGAIGGFGLGSKSPFAYTDTFAVRCWKDRELRVYQMYRGKDRLPMVQLVARSATTEPEGLEVSFDVKPGDVGAFQRAVRLQLASMPILPKLIGTTGQIVRPEYIIEAPGLFAVRNYTNDPWDNAYAVVGGVRYPIRGSLQSQLANCRIDVFAKISDVEVATSREALSYTPKTVAFLEKALAAAEKWLIAYCEKEISRQPTYWDAVASWKDTLSEIGGNSLYHWRNYSVRNAQHFRWRGRGLDDINLPSTSFQKLGIVAIYRVVMRKSVSKDSIYNLTIHPTHIRSGEGGGNYPMFLIPKDLPEWQAGLSRLHRDKKLANTYFVIECANPSAVIAHFQGAPASFFWTEADFPPKAPKVKPVRLKVDDLSKLTGLTKITGGSWMNPTSVTFATGGHYLPTVNSQVRNFGAYTSPDSAYARIRALYRILGVSDSDIPDIYGVPGSLIRRLQRYNEETGIWIPADDFVLSQVRLALHLEADTLATAGDWEDLPKWVRLLLSPDGLCGKSSTLAVKFQPYVDKVRAVLGPPPSALSPKQLGLVKAASEYNISVTSSVKPRYTPKMAAIEALNPKLARAFELVADAEYYQRQHMIKLLELFL